MHCETNILEGKSHIHRFPLTEDVITDNSILKYDPQKHYETVTANRMTLSRYINRRATPPLRM